MGPAWRWLSPMVHLFRVETLAKLTENAPKIELDAKLNLNRTTGTAIMHLELQQGHVTSSGSSPPYPRVTRE